MVDNSKMTLNNTKACSKKVLEKCRINTISFINLTLARDLMNLTNSKPRLKIRWLTKAPNYSEKEEGTF